MSDSRTEWSASSGDGSERHSTDYGSSAGGASADGSTEPSGPDAASVVAGIEVEPVAADEVFGPGIELARRYVESLAIDGVVRGLIGPREAGRLWSRHVLNSAVAGGLLRPGDTVVDIGSGAGLPGIPLAIARPDCAFILVEPLERRTIFLQEMVADLQLANCRVVRGRADQVIDDCGEADVVTSRAVAPLDRLAGWSAPLLKIGGQLLALKGSSASDEIERDRVAVAAVGVVDLEVISVGAGIVDPVTLVVRGRRVAITTAGSRRNSGSVDRKMDRRPRRR